MPFHFSYCLLFTLYRTPVTLPLAMNNTPFSSSSESFPRFPVALLWVLCLNLHNEDEVMAVIFGSQCLSICNPCKVPGFLPAQKSPHNALMGGLCHNAWRQRQNFSFFSSLHLKLVKSSSLKGDWWPYQHLTTAKVRNPKDQPWKSCHAVTTLRSKYLNGGPASLADCPIRRLTLTIEHA